jgi:hypothetical protein
MVAHKFSVQKGSQRQKSLNKFKLEDLQSCLRESSLPLPYTKQPTTDPNQPSAPNPSHVPSTVEAMDVESPSLPLPQSQYSKERCNSGLLLYLQTFSPFLLILVLTNKNTILYSVNSLWERHNMADRPCTLSPSCF